MTGWRREPFERRLIPLARTMSMLRWAALAAIAATAAADNCCHEARGTHEVMEDNTTECCRLVAPMGATAQTLQLNCTMLPVYTCFTNPKGKITTVKRVGSDPGACCAACIKQAGCVSWTHTGESSCNLYSDVGPTKAEDKSGCSAGMIGGHGRPMPPVPPPPPPQPRNGRPNLLFLVVRSRTCAQQPPLQLSRDPAAFRSSRPTAGHGPRGTRTTWSSSRTCASCRTAGSTLSTVSAAAVRPTCLPPTPSACTTWLANSSMDITCSKKGVRRLLEFAGLLPVPLGLLVRPARLEHAAQAPGLPEHHGRRGLEQLRRPSGAAITD